MDRKKFIRTSLLGAMGAGIITNATACKKEENPPTVECTTENACVTQCDEEGPFFKTVANNNTDLTQIGPGDNAIFTNEKVKIKIVGRVLSGINCDEPVADAMIHIWHADPDGHYDVKESSPGAGDAIPDEEVQINFRTILASNDNGEFSFITYQPFGYYNRPQHIHFKVIATGFKELTTQLYFEGDPKLVPGNFSDGISQEEADRIDNDRKVMLNDSADPNLDKEGVFDIHIEAV